MQWVGYAERMKTNVHRGLRRLGCAESMEEIESTRMRSVRYVENTEERIKNDEIDRVCRTHGEGRKEQRGIGINKEKQKGIYTCLQLKII
jgi:hypothetical protein